MPIKINSTGGGSVSIDVPSTGGTYTLTAPANNASIFTTDGGAITGNVAFTSNNVSIGGKVISSYTGMKNRIINGAMMIDQRNNGAVITSNSSSFVVDRFYAVSSTDGTVLAQQSTNAPAGFQNSIKITISVADASMGSGQYVQIAQGIEGYNVADLKWGTADAKTITLSFWVYSSLTGTFSGALRNFDTSRTCVFTYNIISANTWEYKTITLPGDTGGSWNTTNGAGIYMHFAGGWATNKQTATVGSWLAGDYYGANGAVQFVNTNSATWYVTGVQIEEGSVATPFEYRSYGTELRLCQRYYISYGPFGKGYGTDYHPLFYSCSLNNATKTTWFFGVNFMVSMRAQPSMTWSGSGSLILDNGNPNSVSALAVQRTTRESASIYATTSSITGSSDSNMLSAYNNITSYVAFNAEL